MKQSSPTFLSVIIKTFNEAADIARTLEATLKEIAIEPVGSLTNPNLHFNEQLERGLRLHKAAWRLEKLGVLSVVHYGHKLPDFARHSLRWRSR